MKKLIKKLFVIAFICAILSGLWIGYLLFSVDTSISFDSPIYVEIPYGIGTRQVAKIFVDSEILKNPKIFVITALVTGRDKEIRAGRFRFERPLSVWQLIKNITRGGSFDISITIPEGFTIYAISGIVQKELGIDSVAFLAACRDTTLLKKIGIPGPTAEGFLFPETYNIPQGIEKDSLICIMFAEFIKRWSPEYQTYAASLGMSLLEIVTLASIIEAEAYVKSEQTVISSVYHNRLKIGMMLQADPTTIYGLKKFDKPLLLVDLDDDSPYNTYRRLGLPPGPICNPGEDAIRATLLPDSTEYLYFVSRRDGTHIFSRTIQEHHKAIREVKKIINRKREA